MDFTMLGSCWYNTPLVVLDNIFSQLVKPEPDYFQPWHRPSVKPVQLNACPAETWDFMRLNEPELAKGVGFFNSVVLREWYRNNHFVIQADAITPEGMFHLRNALELLVRRSNGVVRNIEIKVFNNAHAGTPWALLAWTQLLAHYAKYLAPGIFWPSRCWREHPIRITDNEQFFDRLTQLAHHIADQGRQADDIYCGVAVTHLRNEFYNGLGALTDDDRDNTEQMAAEFWGSFREVLNGSKPWEEVTEQDFLHVASRKA